MTPTIFDTAGLNVSTVDYSSRAMLVKLTRRTWGINKKDPLVAQAILAQHGASADAGVFTKRIMAKECLKDINTCMNEAYKIHNMMTLPWDDDGKRILSAKNFFEYKNRIAEIESRLDVAVREFVVNYPQWIEEARSRLNGLFNEKDYPAPEEVASLFRLEVEPEPVPTGNNLHIDIAEEYLTAQREEIERRVVAKFNEAHRELYNRLTEVVQHLRDSIVEGRDFKSVTVERVIEMCKMIPTLSIPDDSKLTAAAEKIAEELSKYHPHDIRDNKRISDKVKDGLAAQVQELEHSMFAYFNN